MELHQTSSGIELNGIPNAVSLVSVGGSKAKMLADLILHQSDLVRANQYLEDINVLLDGPDTAREGLYVAALTRCFKCFGKNESRRAYQLDASVILANEPNGMTVYEELRLERNKHVVHDENSALQAHVGAVLNDGTHPHKVEKVLALAVGVELLQPRSWQNLKHLVLSTLTFVDKEIDRLCHEITADLEAESYATLMARAPMRLKPALTADAGRRRDQSHLSS
ncbi:hypothetical protein [Acidovorax sp. SUPP3334]|uniref:hypothetical protein n=1 Tax=Acidovorax sp. SUPP3334 TaxID=2920881 RepID=UPI0023DE585B|nr:hypothetical protein [Acidovorax sp. SUPP3334]GKT22392.1 hypothetical protein AVHM3334_08280 [Acidovorax sp. SUPP3334]